MKTLHISVSNKVAEYRERDGFIVCGNSNYQVEFAFDSEWDEHEEKTARFVWNKQYFDQEFTGNVCPCPIVKNATEVSVGVYAGNLETTTGANIPCRPSILCDETIPHPESGQNYSNEAKQAAEEAKAAAEEAKAHADGIASTEARISKAEKRITNLEKGITPDPFVTDDTVAYEKIAPDNALPYAAVERLGGMSSVIDGILHHAPVTAIRTKGANLCDAGTLSFTGTKLYTLKQTFPAGRYAISADWVSGSSDDSVAVNIQYTDGTYFGLLKLARTYTERTFTATKPFNAVFFYSAGGGVSPSKGVSCTIYDIMLYASESDETDKKPYQPYFDAIVALPEHITSQRGYGLGISEDCHNYFDLDGSRYIQMCDERDYEEGDEDNPDVVTDGTKTVYALATPIEYDIAPIDNYIRVDGGGTLTFVNEHEMSVPSVITYLIKEVTA